MKKSLVILFAVIVAVASAARLPEFDSKPSLAKFEPVLQKIFDHLQKIKPEVKSEDVYENEIPEVVQPKEVADSLEEFHQKPINLEALLKKVESIEQEQQKVAAEPLDKEDEEDSDVILSYGLEKPLKLADIKAEESEDSEEDDKDDDDADVQIGYGLAEPIEVSDLKKDVEEEEETDDDDEDNDSIIPFRAIKENEEAHDDEDVQVSFGLAEPIAFAVKSNMQEDSEDDEEDEDDTRSDINEKVMSEIITGAIKKFAKVHGLKL